MRFISYILILLVVTETLSAQNEVHPFVKLIKETNGKRLELFAENTDDKPYVVFLRITTNDYRRSSKRPVLKTIAGRSKTKLLTMIKLANKEGDYNAQFIVNEATTSLRIRKDREDVKLKINNEFQSQKVTIYTKPACALCLDAIEILNENAVLFNEYSLENDSIVNALKTELKLLNKTTNFNIPVFRINKSLHTNINTKEKFIGLLKRYFD